MSWKHGVFAATVAVSVFVDIQSLRKGLRLQTAEQPPGNDFTSYVMTAEELLAGRDPYVAAERNAYVGAYYPHFVPFAAIPFTWMPAWLAVELWFLLSLACWILALVLSIELAAGETGKPWSRELAPILCALSLAFFPWLQNHFLNGQTNLPALLASILFFRELGRGRSRAPLAALYLALAASIKVFPIGFLGFALLRGRFGTAALTLVWLVVLNGVPAFLLDDPAASYRAYFDRLTGSFAGRSAIPQHRMFLTPAGFGHWIGERLGWIGPDDSLPWLKLASLALVAAVVGAVELRRLLATGTRPVPADSWIFHLYLTAALLVLPVSEKHHLVFVFPGMTVVALALLGNRREDRTLRWLVIAVAAGLAWGLADKLGPGSFLALAVHAAALVKLTRPLDLRNSPPV